MISSSSRRRPRRRSACCSESVRRKWTRCRRKAGRYRSTADRRRRRPRSNSDLPTTFRIPVAVHRRRSQIRGGRCLRRQTLGRGRVAQQHVAQQRETAILNPILFGRHRGFDGVRRRVRIVRLLTDRRLWGLNRRSRPEREPSRSGPTRPAATQRFADFSRGTGMKRRRPSDTAHTSSSATAMSPTLVSR